MSYVRDPSTLGAAADGDALCDLDLDGVVLGELGTLTTGTSASFDVHSALAQLARDGHTRLVVAVAFSFGSGGFVVPPASAVVLSGEVDTPRARPRIEFHTLADGAPPPPSSCSAGDNDCGACLAQPGCGLCASSGKCVEGDGNGALFGAACPDGGFEFAFCNSATRVALPSLAAASCAVSGGFGGGELQVSPLSAWQAVPLAQRSVLAFDVRPLRAALAALSAGGARRIVSARLDLYVRVSPLFGRDTDDALLSAVWLVGNGTADRALDACNALGVSTRSTVIAGHSEPLALGKDAEPRAVGIALDTAVAASVVDGDDVLRLRVSADAYIDIFSPDANDKLRRSPRIVVELDDGELVAADSCAASTTRAECLARGSDAACGWCGDKCVSGTPRAPYDATACAAGDAYEFVDARTTAVALRRIDADASMSLLLLGGNVWPDLAALGGNGVASFELRVDGALDAARVSSAFVELAAAPGARKEAPYSSDGDTSVLDTAGAVEARWRADTAERYEAPLPLYVRDAARGLFALDVTAAVRAAAASSSRTAFVRVSLARAFSTANLLLVAGAHSYFERRAPRAVVSLAADSSAADVVCAVHANCGACSATPLCGWCVTDDGSGACVAAADASQPLAADRTCTAWSFAACQAIGELGQFAQLACPTLSGATADNTTAAALYGQVYSTQLERSALSLVLTPTVLAVDARALVGGDDTLALDSPLALRLVLASPMQNDAATVHAFVEQSAVNVSTIECDALRDRVVTSVLTASFGGGGAPQDAIASVTVPANSPAGTEIFVPLDTLLQQQTQPFIKIALFAAGGRVVDVVGPVSGRI